MTKKQKNIGLGLMVWAGLLIAVLYSPVGSPGLYSDNNYSVENQNVSFKDGSILNASKIKPVTENTDNNLDIPDAIEVSSMKYTIGSYQSTNSYSRGLSSGNLSNNTYQNTNSGSGSMNGGGLLLVSSGSRNNSGSSGITMTNGITTLSLTSNLNTSVSKQSVTTITASTGGTDPGGDPDPGSQIPVGDGWWLFVVFGVVYGFIKMILRRKLNHSIHKDNFISFNSTLLY